MISASARVVARMSVASYTAVTLLRENYVTTVAFKTTGIYSPLILKKGKKPAAAGGEAATRGRVSLLQRTRRTKTTSVADSEPAQSFLRKLLVSRRSARKAGQQLAEESRSTDSCISSVAASASGGEDRLASPVSNSTSSVSEGGAGASSSSSVSEGEVEKEFSKKELAKQKAQKILQFKHKVKHEHQRKRKQEAKRKVKLKKKKTWYCPSAADLDARTGTRVVENDSPHWGAGWIHTGGGWLAGRRWTLNLVGGRIDVDGIDYTRVADGINANVYTTAPQGFGGPGGMNNGCDSGGNHGTPYSCLEMDLMESSGSHGYAVTWHDNFEGGGCGNGGVGCGAKRGFQGKFGLKYTIGFDGCPDIQQIGVHPTQPTPPSVFNKGGPGVGNKGALNCGVVANVHNTRGAMLRSTMWNGWCPDVGNNGNVIHIGGGVKGYPDAQGRSVFALRGIRFYGTLRQGHAPRTCWEKKKQLEAKKKKHVEHVGKHSKHHKEVVEKKNEGKAEPGGAGGNSTTTAPVPVPVGAERDEGEKAAPAVAPPPMEESDPGKAASMEMCCGGGEAEAATLPRAATTQKITKTKKIVKEVKTTKKDEEKVKK